MEEGHLLGSSPGLFALECEAIGNVTRLPALRILLLSSKRGHHSALLRTVDDPYAGVRGTNITQKTENFARELEIVDEAALVEPRFLSGPNLLQRMTGCRQ